MREGAPEARIMLHLDNGGNNALYRNWFDSYFRQGGMDFDYIGLSYYPFWHGTMADLRQHRTIASADISGSFAPILQFEKLEIHKVFLRFPNFILEQNLSLLSLAELCGAALKNNLYDLAERYGKPMIIAEVSMGFTMEDYGSYEGLSPENRKGMATKPELAAKVPYPMTPQGQLLFLEDLMKLLKTVLGNLAMSLT